MPDLQQVYPSLDAYIYDNPRVTPPINLITAVGREGLTAPAGFNCYGGNPRTRGVSKQT